MEDLQYVISLGTGDDIFDWAFRLEYLRISLFDFRFGERAVEAAGWRIWRVLPSPFCQFSIGYICTRF
jgi:hypothetical protein